MIDIDEIIPRQAEVIAEIVLQKVGALAAHILLGILEEVKIGTQSIMMENDENIGSGLPDLPSNMSLSNHAKILAIIQHLRCIFMEMVILHLLHPHHRILRKNISVIGPNR
ncbi:hypothetical protein QR98_0092100 [Sarcoptes scabiei]|uniref:Uncharacterized protein n=1 Tax=Sarcoptes scabiei TaxID=52283 RepID=A0A132AJM3_SARSC|nr:hypothetical protein QR98_0092100 [Sarcoptes scabiei]